MREFLTRFPIQLQHIERDEDRFDKYLVDGIISSTFGGYKKPFYNCIFNNGYQLEGWKIHVSPYLKDYGKVLNIVSGVMLSNKVSFKFAYNLSDYLLLSDKNISPSQFGKYITIYPKNDSEFKILLDALDGKLKGYSGVHVPSDHSYKNSKIISYRFGGFFPQIHMDIDGNMEYKILDGVGDFVPDVRKTYFELPNGIIDPFRAKDKVQTKIASPYLVGEETGKKFEIISIIRRLGTGNIYEGIDSSNKKHVIVKEARSGALPNEKDSIYRAWNLKKNEIEILKNNKIRSIVNMPNYIDYLHIDDSFYVVEEKIEGMSLRELLQQNLMLNKSQSKSEKDQLNQDLIEFWSQILKLVTQLHKLNYIINDISDDNFLYNKKTKRIALTDVETIQPVKDNKYDKIATENFCIRMPENIDDYNKDCYKLSLLMFYTVFNKVNEFIFDKDFFRKRFNLLKNKLTINQQKILCSAFKIHELSKANIISNSFDLADTLSLSNLEKYSEPLTDVSILEIKHIKDKILKQYKDNESTLWKYLKSTPYVGDASDCSLIYGKLGTILLLKKEIKNLDITPLISKARNQIVELNSKKQLNLGLFFGLAGTALFEFYADIPFGKNYSLIKLIERLETEQQNNSLCNGYAGIVYALQKMSSKKGYPDFTKKIEAILLKLQDDIGKTTDEGLEYGDLGTALVLLNQFSITKRNEYLVSVDKIIENCKNLYKNDKAFTGISYNLHKWKNIRSPYLMNGSAGLIFILFKYISVTNNDKWKLIDKFIDSLDLPFTYNYGVNNGTAGILLVIKLMLAYNGDIPKRIYNKLIKLDSYYSNHLFYSFIDSRVKLGWPSDGQVFIADDLGSGNLGILLVLNMTEYRGEKK